MKKKSGITIIICCFIVIAIIFALVYIGDLNNKKGSSNNSKYDEKYFLNIIEKDLDILYEHATLNLSDEIITRWAYNHLDKLQLQDSFNSKLLEDYIDKSPLRNVEYDLTDIYQMSESYSNIDNDNICYALKDDTYYSSDCGGRGMAKIEPFYSKVEKFLVYDNKYHISVKNIFYYSNYDGPVDIALYNSYGNIIDDLKFDGHYNTKDYVSEGSFPRSFAVFALNPEDEVSTAYEKAKKEANKYISENWDEIKDYISTYNYVFEITGGKPVLVDISADYSEIPPAKKYTVDNVTKGDLDYIIGNYLDILLEKKSLNDLTDRELTNWLYNNYIQNTEKELSSTHDMDAALSESLFKNMKFNYTNIYDFYGNYDSINKASEDDVLIKLDENGNYKEIETSGHEGYGIFPYYCDITNYTEKDNKYYVSQKCIFFHLTDVGDPIGELYSNYESDKPFKTFEVNENSSYDELSVKVYDYVTNNWDKIKNNLDTYNYVFEIQNNKLVLVDFNRTSK